MLDEDLVLERLEELEQYRDGLARDDEEVPIMDARIEELRFVAGKVGRHAAV